jgi:hypothetical protein
MDTINDLLISLEFEKRETKKRRRESRRRRGKRWRSAE